MTAKQIREMIKAVTGNTVSVRTILAKAQSLPHIVASDGAYIFRSSEIESILIALGYDPQSFYS
jgi:hypothetical protein